MTRDRHALSDMGSDLKGIVGGEIVGQTKELTWLVEEVMNRLVAAAAAAGADGIVGLRFVSPDTGRWAEIIAYGTAVPSPRRMGSPAGTARESLRRSHPDLLDPQHQRGYRRRGCPTTAQSSGPSAGDMM